MYNIGFTLGDPSSDGHGMTKEFHIETSHSAQEITNAYKKATEKLGWNYTTSICSEYEDSTIDLEQVEDIENKLNIDIKGCLSDWQIRELKRKGYCYLDCYPFIDIFFEIVSSEIPKFQWKEVDFNEDRLHSLDGAGYGLFSN